MCESGTGREDRWNTRQVLVTGGAGFSGSTVIRHRVREVGAAVVNVDKLTYAAMPEELEDVAESPRYAFAKADICDGPALRRVFAEQRPDAALHLAADSHVDRSINTAAAFVKTNVGGPLHREGAE